MEGMVVTYMQRKVCSRKKSIDEYMKVYGYMFKIIWRPNNLNNICKKFKFAQVKLLQIFLLGKYL